MKPYFPIGYRQQESGAVLIVALVMVLLISIVALSGMRSSNLQEAMAGNTRDQNMAFQAAETGLVAGEALVDYRVKAPDCMGVTTCLPGQPANEAIIYLDKDEFTAKSRESGVDLGDVGIEEMPRFIIEELSPVALPGSSLEKGGAPPLLPYRVTSRGSGLGSDSSVILQTTYNHLAPE